jgi:hypothetical protein
MSDQDLKYFLLEEEELEGDEETGEKKASPEEQDGKEGTGEETPEETAM